MKHIVLFGAGKSATVLIEYLKDLSTEKQWKVTVADGNLEAVQSKVGSHELTSARQVDITNDEQRKELVRQADVVISLMPPSLHFLIAKDCIEFSKHLLTASYVDRQISDLQSEIVNKHLLFLCEMGLDPGIDHMSAMKIINEIKAKGGRIDSFKSHCGGLVAPESDDNPWHYKISWNPRNVVMAGKAGAEYKEKGELKHKNYEQMFDDCPPIATEGLRLAYYPNRDSLSYIPLYKLDEASTFIRTTLRYPDFCYGWKHIIRLKLTDETPAYDTDGMSLQQFFQLHLKKYGFEEWIQKQVADRNDGAIKIMNQLSFLGLDDKETIIKKGLCSAADVLQFILERKLVLQPMDKDMIVMLHEIGYTVNSEQFAVNSSLMVEGRDSLHTAMAKTVGLPLGIAAKQILEGNIRLTGLHIPTSQEIYDAVLPELENYGIKFNEEVKRIS